MFAGRRLAERVVDLTSLLNSEDMRDFENNMWVLSRRPECMLLCRFTKRKITASHWHPKNPPRLIYFRFVRGWFTPYHRQRKMVNPLITMQIQSHATTWVWMRSPSVCNLYALKTSCCLFLFQTFISYFNQKLPAFCSLVFVVRLCIMSTRLFWCVSGCWLCCRRRRRRWGRRWLVSTQTLQSRSG